MNARTYHVAGAVVGDDAPRWDPTIVSGEQEAETEMLARILFRLRYENQHPGQTLDCINSQPV